MKSDDITGGLDLLGDWLDAKGYTEEASLCTRAMDEINRLQEKLNGLVVAVDWEATAIIGGADDAVARAQILQACARAAVGESDE